MTTVWSLLPNSNCLELSLSSLTDSERKKNSKYKAKLDEVLNVMFNRSLDDAALSMGAAGLWSLAASQMPA